MNVFLLMVFFIETAFSVDKDFEYVPKMETLNQVKDLTLVDESFNRVIPVRMYLSKLGDTKDEVIKTLPVVVINHGYGVLNTEYSFIAKTLASYGYDVISILHDLENDPPLARTGDLFERRKPLWERGTNNILVVISELKKKEPKLSVDHIILIGHSNGGDISMMFVDKYPEFVNKVVSLDSLRYPFPTKNKIPILSLRANDTNADKGVLPDFGTTIVQLDDAKHIDMCDRGPEFIKKEIVSLIIKFLER